MPAENLAGKAIRFPGVCMESAFSVVNALSETMEVWVKKPGNLYYQCYHKGVPVEAVKNNRKSGGNWNNH